VTWIVIAFVVLSVIAAFVLIARNRQQGSTSADEAWPFQKTKPLSDPEQALYHLMVAALPECIVLAQVPLSRVLRVDKRPDSRSWQNRISQKSLDFVVCLKDFTVVAAVELDDATHARQSRQTADANKDRALAAAGVSIVRWNVKALPDESAIRGAFTT
jgi:hypothetical protein